MLIAALSLAACATAASAPERPPAPREAAAKARCPQVPTYGEAERLTAADHLDRLPAGSPVITMLGDYAIMMRAARRCRGEAVR